MSMEEELTLHSQFVALGENFVERERDEDARAICNDALERETTPVVETGALAIAGADNPFRIMVETMAEGAVTLSREGTVLYCNPAFANLLRRPLGELRGVPFAPWVAEECKATYAALLASGPVPWRSNLRLRRGDGAEVPVEVAASRVDLPSFPGALSLVILSMIEHERRVALEVEQETARVREEILCERQQQLERLNFKLAKANGRMMALYLELREKARQLKRADAMKTRFLSNISHEFRSPLHSIFGITSLLLCRAEGTLNSEQDKLVGYIRNAADSLLELVNDLLDLAKIEAGKIEIRPSEFSAAEMLAGIQGMLSGSYMGSSVQLIFEEPADMPPFYSDHGKIAQILRNLIGNALKFTEQGEVRVSASYDGSTDIVTFTVRDTGVGIAQGDQEKIFDEFTQLENPAQNRVKGTGLGLPLCRKLATLLDGRVILESEPGRGSTFSLILPRSYLKAGKEALLESLAGEAARAGTVRLAG
jgi:signal transduction histidine kinase